MKLDREQLGQMDPVFTVRTPVEIEDRHIDSYGNHLNQSMAFKLFEEARSHFLEAKGLTPEYLMATYGALGFVVEQDAKYKSQVYKGEKLEIDSSVYLKGARFFFRQKLERDGVVTVDALVEIAMVNKVGRPVRIDPKLLSKT